MHAQSGLSVMAAGPLPPNPAELLQSQAMEDLLTKLRERYSVIIIDAPPLLPVTDAALLAAQTDGAILVVRHGETTRDQLTGAVERLEGVESRPLGVIFNMMPMRRGARVWIRLRLRLRLRTRGAGRGEDAEDPAGHVGAEAAGEGAGGGARCSSAAVAVGQLEAASKSSDEDQGAAFSIRVRVASWRQARARSRLIDTGGA